MTQNFWTSFNPNCPRAPNFLQDVVERKPIPWLQRKTVFVVGDSVERNAGNFFCELVSSVHQYDRTWENIVITTANGSQYTTSPQSLRVYRIDEYDFEIVSFYHYGLQEVDIYFGHELPRFIEQRMQLFKRLTEFYERKPDMITLTSGISSFNVDLI